MKVVIAQHKGGVGKTSLATHIAGVLSNSGFEKTLVMDCDSQADAYMFFSGGEDPSVFGDLYKNGKDDIDVLWNPNREKLSNMNRFDSYDNIVVDINTKFSDIIQTIMELIPDLILIPVDKQKLSKKHIRELLETLNELQGRFIYPLEVKIVQMGSNHDFEFISDISESQYEIINIPYLYKEFDDSLSTSKYVWENKHYASLKSCFEEVINNG